MASLPARLVMSELAYLAYGPCSRLPDVMKRFEARGRADRYPDAADRRRTRCGRSVSTCSGRCRSPTSGRPRIADKLQTRPEDVTAD